MASIVGVASGKFNNENESGFRSGIGVRSGDSGCGCICGLKLSIIHSWQECDTLSKKIGFIFGKVINFLISIISHVYNLISKIITSLRLNELFGKIFEVFCRIIKGISKKICDFTMRIFENYIKPIFINKITKKIFEIVKEVCLFFYNHLIVPIGNIVKKVLLKISNRLHVKTEINMQGSKIAKIFEKFLNSVKTVLRTTFDWTFVPLWNRALYPILSSIGDIFLGMVGGYSQKNQPSHEENDELNPIQK